ncbi:lactonase family protein [Nocardia harenae]|uniref:lactonase family protein n=1 Tax=Nocardia harenae TaxID=358707 RepID=UPI000835FB60|nr:beta-propeller fold lactonase family protein [Nocardia harenae]
MKRRSMVAVVAMLALSVAAGAPGQAAPGAGTGGPEHVYAVGALSDVVVGLNVSSTGAPQLLANPVRTGYGTLGLASSPDGKYLYVGLTLGLGIAAFEINTDGTLRELPGSPVKASGPVATLSVAPDGRHLYGTVTDDLHGSVVTYPIGPNGLPGPAVGSAELDMTSHFGMLTIAPNGRNLYMADGPANQIVQMPIGADGIARPGGQRIPAGGIPVSPGVTPDGKFLFSPNETGSVSVYSIGASGALTEVPGSPYASGTIAHGVTFSPDSTRAYIPHAVSNTIAGFSIAPDGRLTPLPGSPYDGEFLSAPGRALTSRDGKRVYVVEVASVSGGGSSRLRTYDVLPDGALRESERAVDLDIAFADGPCAVITGG